MLVAVLCNSGTPSAADNGTTPSTFTADASDTNRTNRVFIFRANNITLPGSGSYTVTVTVSPSQVITAAGISYLGVIPGAPTAVSSNDAASNGPVSTGSASPNTAGGLAFAAFCDSLASGTDAIVLTNGSFTDQFKETNATSFVTGGVADWLSPSAANCTWTVSAGVTTWAGVIAVYDATSDSGPAYAAAAADLGGGSGSWASTGNADGAPDSSYATWTVP